MNRKFTHSLVYTSLILAGVSNALAQDSNEQQESEVERIVITADLAQRDLSELPATAYVIDQAILDARNARHIEDVLATVPSVNVSSGASRGRFVQIRGIGERSQFAEPINPSIGILLDDIDISGIGGLATVYDIQQVEVLLGPQSVASGINSVGGVVKLLSNPAYNDMYANVSASLGQFNERRLAATYSNALGENVNARFALQSTQADGFVENIFLNRDDTNGIDEVTLKALFNIELENNNSLDINLYRFDIDNGYDAFSLDNDRKTRSDKPGKDSVDANAASAKYSHNFDQHLLQLTTTYLSSDTIYSYDEDWTFDGFDPIGYSSTDSYQRDLRRVSVDLKLANAANDDNTYLIGINVYKNDEDLLRQNTFIDGDYISNYKPSTASIYGQYIWQASDAVNVTTAARFEKFSAKFSDNAGSTSVDDSLFAASVAIDYSVNDTLLFASVSRGYKAAGFNIDPRLPVNNRAFDSETNYSYELGAKGFAFDGMAEINLTFFYMTRKDAQVSDSLVVEVDGSNARSFIDGIGNADSGINKGVELSSTFDLSQNWYVQANVGYLDATFGDYRKINGDFVPEQEQAYAPKISAYLASNYQFTENLSWHIDVQYKDDFRLGINHDVRTPSTALFNTELTWQSTGEHLYSISVWAKNLTDKDYITRGFGSFPNDPRDGYSTNGPYFQYSQPRQVGVSFTYEWQ